MSWEKVISKEELDKKQKTVFKKGSKQIVVLQAVNQIYAIDNRCPHEGYPLAQGNMDNEHCVLTCNWHNWKFDLKNGQCLTGGDNVRTYNTKIEDDYIFVDLSEPTKEEITQTILEGFKVAFLDRQYGRISRELSRLCFNRIDPLIALKKAIEWSYNKFEYGMTHAYAATADWLTFYSRQDDLENKLICLTEAIDHIAFDSLRYPTFAFTEETKTWDYDSFINAVEKEDEKTAISLILGALAEGKHFEDLEKALTHSALKHYNDFGHALIYVYKAGNLVKFLGYEVEKPLLLSLVRSLCYSTREDLLPEFKEYSNYLEKLTFVENGKKEVINSNLLFNKSVNDSMKFVVEKAQEVEKESIYEALLKSNCKNLLNYDTTYQFSYDKSINDNVGWLDFTHAITFSNAVRVLCTRYPEFWANGLLQIACFNGRNSHYLDLNLDEKKWLVTNEPDFWQELSERILDHGIAAPIFSAHLLKTAYAVKEECGANSDFTKQYLLSALNRFANSPIKAKHIRRTVRQSIELVSKDFK